MKLISALVVAQLFLFVSGGDLKEEHKQVGCYYAGAKSVRHGGLDPKDIDPSLCSHLTYLNGLTNNETGNVEFTSLYPWQGASEDGMIPKLVKLKEVNPDLKLILAISPAAADKLLRAIDAVEFVTIGVKWLNETGFDGLEFPFYIPQKERERLSYFMCYMKTELDKYGYTLSSTIIDRDFPEPTPGKEGTLERLARCSERVTMIQEESGKNSETYRLAPINNIRSNVDWMIRRGVPANKIAFTVPVFGVYVTLEDPNETGMGAKYSGPGLDYKEFSGRNTICYKELLKELKKSSLEWTIHRDDVTKELYAYSSTGLWTSYEDASSMEFKARYATEKGLKGIEIMFLDLDDYEGVGGEGRFPLTRAVYNTFHQGN